MIKQWLKFGFSLGLAGLFLLILTPKTFAADYEKMDITLRAGRGGMVSETYIADFRFNSIGIKYTDSLSGLMADFGDGWREVNIKDDGYGPETLMFTSPSNTLKFKTDFISENPIVLEVYIFGEESEIGGPDTSNLQAGTEIAMKDFSIISRSDWGADETLRYWTPDEEDNAETPQDETTTSGTDPCTGYEDKFASELGIAYTKEFSPSGDILTWPLQYMKNVRKFVIHHTDSEIRDLNGDNIMDGRDYKAIVRAIYRYHTITRGWGDIGYNYLIDPLGNIYEGRYGGDKVIGAHTMCYNNGSIGIAIIGDYTDDDVPEPALQSLISLIARKAKEYNIDPVGSTVFRGVKTPNILGHRDLKPTACPGQKLYDLLGKIRDRAALAIRSGTFSEGNLQAENLDYNAQFVSEVSNINLNPNETRAISLKFKNTGKKTWDQNTWLHVALNNNTNARLIPVIEDKAFVAADMKEISVVPGNTGTFDIQIEGGYYPGTYDFEVAPVVNGRYKVSLASTDVSFNVEKPNFSYEVVKSELPSGNIFQGQKVQGSIELKNTGNVIWRNYGNNPIMLGTSGPRDRKSIFIKTNPSRLGYMIESEVKPGETGYFVMDLDVPVGKTGTVVEQFTPVIENVGWLDDKALGFKVTVKEPIHLAAITKLNEVSALLPGEMKKIELKMENKGDLAWDMDNMVVTLLGRGVELFKSKLIPLEPVAPQKSVNFDFWVQAPYEGGSHSIFLRGKYNKIPIRGGTARYLITVPKPSLRAQLVSQGDESITLRPGEEKEITVKLKNTGNAVWRNKGPNAAYLGSSEPRDRLSRLYYEDGWTNKYRAATLKENVIYPGETGTFTFKIKPTGKGIYKEGFQLVLENVGWVIGSSVRWTFRVFGDPVTGSNVTSVTVKPTVKTTTVSQTTSQATTTTTAQTVTQQTTTTTKTTEKPFRVRLSYNADNSTITADRNFKATDGDGKELFSMTSGQELTVTRINTGIHVQFGTISKSASVIRIIPEDEGIVEITSWENRPAWNQALNDNIFRGAIEIRAINGETAYINELPLEDYLKGLGEVSNDSPFEKLKTIAVLARSYARFYMDSANRKFPGMPYDGSDDPDIFQKYLGYGLEKRSPNVVGAAAITKDEVVTYQGKLIKPPYFNQSDGRTRSAQEVWGWTDTPYLVSVADPWCAGMTLQGHGVGLSGYGATKQAEEGKTYDDIIKYYYQGVEVQEMNFE